MIAYISYLIELGPRSATYKLMRERGMTPQEALQDEEGLDTMRQLGENMAWLLRCIAAGKASGIERREIQPKRRTNFIR